MNRDQIAIKLIFPEVRLEGTISFLSLGEENFPFSRTICIAVNASYDLCMRCLTEAKEQTRMFTKYHGASTSVYLPAQHTLGLDDVMGGGIISKYSTGFIFV